MDVVVTVPKTMWKDWLFEGDLPGENRVGCPDCGWEGGKGAWRSHHGGRDGQGQLCMLGEEELEWEYYLNGGRPKVEPGDRVYVVAHNRLRGYSPLIRLQEYTRNSYGLVRGGGAVAVTIAEPIRGFQGWRYVFWKREDEIPFPDWKEV